MSSGTGGAGRPPRNYAHIARAGAGRASDGVSPVLPATAATHVPSRHWPGDDVRGTRAAPARAPSSPQLVEDARSEVLGLDMSNSRIRVLTPAVCRFTFLTELRLGGNMLSRLPAGISALRSLCFLDLSNNQLAELPAELGWLSCLRELLLFNNMLADLPAEVGYLYQLENLGIDGNPLNESLLQIAHAQGPLALVPFLRDHMVAVAPPGDRMWHALDVPGAEARPSLTVMCYNVLCEKYATPQMFGYVPSWFLNWEYRKQVITHEILSYDADVVCLQEVEASQFDAYFKPQLRMRGGYDGFFYAKSRAKTMSDWDRTFVDGCALFFKADRFRLEDKAVLEFNQLALGRPALRKHKDVYNRVMTRDNIAVVARLRHAASGCDVIVANAHIHWDPAFRDVKLVQTVLLAEELEKMALVHPRAALVVCGDFNSLPGSGVLSFLEGGAVPADHDDWQGHVYEPYTSEGAHHALGLRSAYAAAPEPLSFTSFTSMFLGVIDYVFYRPGPLAVSGVLGSIPADYVKQLVGLPSQALPSDHVSLLVEFRVEPAKAASARPPPDDASQRRLYARSKNAHL